MKIKIVTSEIEFEMDFPKASTGNHVDSSSNDHLIRLIKEVIKNASEETIKIKNRN